MGDYRNEIRRVREKTGMSQRELAAAVGTSQQQIQRYETGSAVKLHIAVGLAEILGTTVDRLFPESKQVVRKIRRKGPSGLRQGLSDDDEISKGLLEAGIEVDPCQWTARIVIRGGDPQRPMLYSIGVRDKDRVNLYLEWGCKDSVEAKRSDENARFFVFDSKDRTVAVNIDHVAFWQNIFDLSMEINDTDSEQGDQTAKPEKPEPAVGISVYWAGIREPVSFDVDADVERGEDEDGDEGQCRNLLLTLETEPEKDSFLSFTDVDGEVAYLRVGDVAILEVARSVTDPEPLEDNGENERPESQHSVVARLSSLSQVN